ncbi:helix-turn-helix domain-containing protein [Lentibacillus cibarius]|uniref:Helix-turn-helix domain-containing protein n=1 Tax=Lentibacillus cibarius TaxID=2583219 RepID=A0A549YKQ2_9BACI|nr:helix-turn-helix domain-containing protein [Lentibacillus cibarius]TRM12459.1 helix-turn-helix domain-containing protein [Lentibacillus cibarius]
MEIGERLKEAREAKNLSLDKLQDMTKIQKRYLDAIEQGNFGILPGKFYARAFIKEYASAVGLDAKELMEEHKDEIPQTEEETPSQYTYIHRSRKDNSPAKGTSVFSLIPTVIVVLLIIGILAVVWFFAQDTSPDTDNNNEAKEPQEDNAIIRDSDDSEQEDGQYPKENDTGTKDGPGDTSDSEQQDQQDEQTDSSSNEDIDNASPELVVEEIGSGSPPESTLTLKHASNDITLKIETSGESWLEVENGNGESLFSNMFGEDESPLELDVSDEDRIWINAGSAPNLDVSIDGLALTYPVDPEKEVFQHIWINLNKDGDQTD